MTEPNGDYRILRYYFAFFGTYGCTLQKRRKFLWWHYWETLATNKLGDKFEQWKRRYNCSVIECEDEYWEVIHG
jgi:hypothetical protein